ncbi:MAG: regulatory signaling modulator protein AmpE [Gammaproteobacteria bacterium]
MTLLALLIVFAAEILFLDAARYRDSDSYLRFMEWLRDRLRANPFWNGWPGAVAVVVAGPLVVGLFQDALEDGGLIASLLLLGLSAAALFWSMSGQPLAERVEAYLAAGDPDARRAAISDLLGREPDPMESRWDGQATIAIFEQAVDRVFGPVFWFIVLGPFGAVLYRSVSLMRADIRARGVAAADMDAFDGALVAVHVALAWIPVRLMVLSHSVVGSFVDTMEGWRAYELRCVGQAEDDNAALSVCAGLGALSIDPGWISNEDRPAPGHAEIMGAAGLIKRSAGVWVGGAVLLTLFGVLA